MTIDSASLGTTVLLTLARNHHLTLTVSGPYKVHRFEFKPGQVASTGSLFDKAFGSLPAGNYAWQLTATPARPRRRRPAIEETHGGRSTPDLSQIGFTQSGYFTIGGECVH